MRHESSREQGQVIAQRLEYFAERANLLFSYHFCILEFQNDDDFHKEASDGSRAWMLKTIKNACLHTSLMALRDMNDFFTPMSKKSREDDLLASDFGMEGTFGFLTVDERTWINKLIAHTTQHGLENAEYRWDILELLSKAIAQCNAFLEWIKKIYSLDNVHIFIVAVVMQKKVESILKAIHEESNRQHGKT
jgi:hypothetical protein